MKKRAIYTVLLLPLTLYSYGQHVLTADNNMMRSQDEIIKQQVDYKSPGRPGENVLWDFGMLNMQNDAYTLFYTEDRNNRIRGTEHNTRYYYELKGDSLFRTGYENPTTLSVNAQPELLMKFPVHYGDSTLGYYNSNGKYSERLKISAMGTVKTKADAYGMMILPNKDTLKNVLRIHTVKKIAESTERLNPQNRNITAGNTHISPDSIRLRIENDSMLLEIETYQWYVKGYRYPVFETVKSITNKNGEITDFFDVAFFYPPQEHYYLEDDPGNLAALEDNADEEPASEGNKDEDEPVFTYNTYPNPVQDVLTLEYYTEKPSTITITLLDMQRRPLYNKSNVCRQGDVQHVQINMSSLFKGCYMLIIETDSGVFNEVIFKK